MNRNIFHGMRTGRDWHEIESRANWTDLIAVVIGLVILVVGCGVLRVVMMLPVKKDNSHGKPIGRKRRIDKPAPVWQPGGLVLW